MVNRNTIGKLILRTPVRVAKDSEVYIGDNTADIDIISSEQKKKKKDMA
jgi:hypothetical protein